MKTVENYYLQEDLNCAETTIRLANDRFQMGLTDDEMKLVAGFGGGFCCQKTCGALSSCVAAIARMTIETRAHATPALKPAVADFVKLFEETFGSTDCAELTPKYKTEDRRCAALVEQCQVLFNDYMDKLGYK